MRLTYDPRHNIAYIRLREKRAEVESIRVSLVINKATGERAEFPLAIGG